MSVKFKVRTITETKKLRFSREKTVVTGISYHLEVNGNGSANKNETTIPSPAAIEAIKELLTLENGTEREFADESTAKAELEKYKAAYQAAQNEIAVCDKIKNTDKAKEAAKNLLKLRAALTEKESEYQKLKAVAEVKAKAKAEAEAENNYAEFETIYLNDPTVLDARLNYLIASLEYRVAFYDARLDAGQTRNYSFLSSTHNKKEASEKLIETARSAKETPSGKDEKAIVTPKKLSWASRNNTIGSLKDSLFNETFKERKKDLDYCKTDNDINKLYQALKNLRNAQKNNQQGGTISKRNVLEAELDYYIALCDIRKRNGHTGWNFFGKSVDVKRDAAKAMKEILESKKAFDKNNKDLKNDATAAGLFRTSKLGKHYEQLEAINNEGGLKTGPDAKNANSTSASELSTMSGASTPRTTP